MKALHMRQGIRMNCLSILYFMIMSCTCNTSQDTCPDSYLIYTDRAFDAGKHLKLQSKINLSHIWNTWRKGQSKFQTIMIYHWQKKHELIVSCFSITKCWWLHPISLCKNQSPHQALLAMYLDHFLLDHIYFQPNKSWTWISF